ncbi:hypothetical protein NW762_011837 [Fusarium torreyae]|uniref:Mitochondrial import inner membrane translocase subunit TIM50 n=1 Tax=Fusarium torreyae TaxID=1237075 RepID=A0A9W8VA67_9HYPO|nr:hypothetical protein NW762_011837 [Fusarium torreyae]
MTAYTSTAIPTAPASMGIPGLTLVQPNAAPKNAPKGPKNSKAAPKSQAPPPKAPEGPKSKSKPIPPQEFVRAESPPKVPSPASGGVPNPTPQYITQAHLNPQRLNQPRRILIVMDLNGTLLYRPNKKRPFNFVERPHAKSFLNYCLDTFYVAIWSSARPENVSKMVDNLLTPEQRERCLLVWGRDSFGLSKADYDTKVQVYKRLTTVWSNPRVLSSHPQAHKGGHWDQSNTILVDDSFEKARSEPFNLLPLPEFSGLATEIPNVLPQVHDYLNELAHQTDISRFVRQSPFKLDPNYILPQRPA